MYIPNSTYRVQLHKDFTFKQLQQIIDYLQALGISTVYAAPVVTATPGSMHGYDVTDFSSINPEIGTQQQLLDIVKILKDKGMGWLQDIVPNHMAFSPFNDRLMDVLERGPASPYYQFFDIDWNHPSEELNGKLMVPFLGNEREECISKNEIQLEFSEKGFTINYFETKYPLSSRAFDFLSKHLLSENKLAEQLNAYVNRSSDKDFLSWQKYKAQWIKDSVSNKHSIEKLVSLINTDKSKLDELLSQQYYSLSFWKRTEKEINYRRFFTVNSLICLRMEDEKVFQEYHAFFYTLYKERIIQGLRIDHIDGLNDPSHYVKRLREHFGEDCYIIAEKILEAKEDMPEYWPLQGTSGYEFLSYVNQLFTNRKGADQLMKFYRTLVPEMMAYDNLVFNNKKLILENHMAGEWENLLAYFFLLQLEGDFERENLKQALALLMLCLPVYRIYPDRLPLKGKSLKLMTEAFEKSKQRNSRLTGEIEYLQNLFTNAGKSEDEHKRIILFLRRLMQFTGPLMAKGVEDTTFYIYNPLISHDEVGDAPSTLGITVQEFHRKMIARQTLTPLSLNATATHDTKRGEDSRLRLNVLSELADAWQSHVTQWFVMNEAFHVEIDNVKAPSINDEYFIYQSIVGGFPADFIATEAWITRLETYLLKVVREAKINSNWESPNEAYEDACKNFIRSILSPSHGFLNSFIPFIKIVCHYANTYSLAQVLVKITAPGIPDIYQGCALWDLSYVDPDNRRPVDYMYRQEIFTEIDKKEAEGKEALFSFLKLNRQEAYEKLFVTYKGLNFRKRYKALFTDGEYVPLVISGEANCAMAYARIFKKEWAIVIVPLDVVKNNVNDFDSNNSNVTLPADSPTRWLNILTEETLHTDGQIALSEVFKTFSVALLRNQ